ncbi:chaperone [Lithospermum erythrorhizon]|uniref:Chaperone n=1 Tax=Lithospermum erythrorhizon TaxID=34254 RepID=A0AAV3NI38_LITER
MSSLALQPLFDRLFSNAFRNVGLTNSVDFDWKETEEAHIFKFELPGFTREEVKLQIHDDKVLDISAERKLNDESEKGEFKWHCKERTQVVNFHREFRLPDNALVDQISASMRDGVLIVSVGKDKQKKSKEKAKHKVVDIDDHENGSHAKGLGRFVCCKA